MDQVIRDEAKQDILVKSWVHMAIGRFDYLNASQIKGDGRWGAWVFSPEGWTLTLFSGREGARRFSRLHRVHGRPGRGIVDLSA